MRLVLLLAALAALLLSADAAGQRSKVLADCSRNDGVVAGSYSAAKLRRAYRSIPAARRVADDCAQSVASHLAAMRGRKGGRKAGAVLEDCTRHGGRLTRRFAPHALNRAATRMTPARREQTRCLVGILSQLRARGRPIAVARPGRGRVRGPFNRQTGAQLRDSMKPFTAALRRPPVASDHIPENVFETLQRRNENRDDGFDYFTVRRVGPGDTPVWLIAADGRMCGIRWYGDTIPPDIKCIAANRWARGEGMFDVLPHSDASHDVWGVIPDAFERGTLLFGDGDRSRPLVTSGNGVLDQLEQIPGAVQWHAYDGKQWFDTTRLPCSTDCLDVPPVP